MKKYYIYVVLTKTNSTLSKVIEKITKDQYTHAAISLDKKLEEMYGFSRKYTYNPFIGVLKKEDITKGLYKHQKILIGKIIELEVSRKEYRKFRTIFHEYIDERDRYKYNTKGLFYGLINKEKNSKDRFLCSEFVYHLLKKSGIVNWQKASNLIRPQDLTKLEGKIVYEGDLKKLGQKEEIIISRKERYLCEIKWQGDSGYGESKNKKRDIGQWGYSISFWGNVYYQKKKIIEL